MFGPQMEREFQVKTFNNQQLLKQMERQRQLVQEIAGEQRAAQPQHNSIGKLLGRLSFRNRTAPAGSTS